MKNVSYDNASNDAGNLRALAPEQVRAAILTTARSVYARNGNEIIGLYLTDPELTSSWNSYGTGQRIACLDGHLENMRGRRVRELAEKFIPDDLPARIKTAVIHGVIRLGVSRDLLDKKTLQGERDYRNSLFGTALYSRREGLFKLTDEEKRRAGRSGGFIGGRKLFEDKKGIHAQTHKDHVEHGKRLYQEGKGVFSLTMEEKKSIGIKTYRDGKGIAGLNRDELVEAAKKGVAARGRMPYDNKEIERLMELAAQPKGSRIVRGGWQDVAAQLNAEFGNERSWLAYQNRYYSEKQRKE